MAIAIDARISAHALKGLVILHLFFCITVLFQLPLSLSTVHLVLAHHLFCVQFSVYTGGPLAFQCKLGFGLACFPPDVMQIQHDATMKSTNSANPLRTAHARYR